ncbi:MAG: N-acetyltransferase [Rhodospirillales bacterium]|nr:N-acetyltransferase [Rhodospirillales bacterium]
MPTPEAHGQWCASFFAYPLTADRLQRYLDSAKEPNARAIFTALLSSGEAVGHVEIGHIWPYLSSRLSRVLVDPARRGKGIGRAVVGRAVAFSFETHGVARIDLGVDADNAAAIACYAHVGFSPVNTWPRAMSAGPKVIDVYWMTLTREAWTSARGGLAQQVLELGEDLFDGVQVWGVFWQEEQLGAGRSDGLTNGLSLVAPEIVDQDDVAWF